MKQFAAILIFGMAASAVAWQGLWDEVYFAAAPDVPETWWQVEIQTTAINQPFTVRVVNGNPLKIEWGDGAVSNIVNTTLATFSHTYATAGVYTVSLSGEASNIRFGHDAATRGRLKKLLTVVQGVEGLTSFEFTFYDSAITNIPVGMFDNCPDITTFRYAWMYATELVEFPTGLFDNNKKVTHFGDVFRNCTALNFDGPIVGDGELELWERAGQPGYPSTITGARFAEGAHDTFRAIVPTAWGGTME